ncbi:hypothetical protein [Hamadaea tsunoensis]|uniref:hypothetical protein n=1 Tax=Hamadaea tsunoensis TaxID=53368 RepID=UPI0003F8F661|nr:hypothetical protein [Hamadaea tsunoensis]
MLVVLRSLGRHRRDLAQHPFLSFLVDSQKDPADRLAFAPCLAPFVLGFSDVNVLGR